MKTAIFRGVSGGFARHAPYPSCIWELQSTMVQHYAACESTGQSIGTIACRSASVHRRQDKIVQDVGGQHSLQWEIRIQTGRHYDDKVKGWNHDDTLAAQS